MGGGIWTSLFSFLVSGMGSVVVDGVAILKRANGRDGCDWGVGSWNELLYHMGLVVAIASRGNT